LVGLPLVMAMMIMGGSSESDAGCTTGRNSVALAGDAGAQGLTEQQLANVSVIIAEGLRLAVPERGIVIALAVASQESGFRNYANDGAGGDLKPDQQGIEKSLELPHEAVGTDHGSLGVFQQQWPWWGSMVELMDPASAARKFYAALLRVSRWESMAVTDAAQTVQKSAYPRAYQDDVPLALALVASADASGIERAGYFGGASGCGSVGFAGDVVMPLLEGASYVDRASFGARGSRWSSTHTGTDFSAACGTTVVAATAGVVTVRTDQGWAGRWLVQVDSGSGGVVTWYAHMQRIVVSSGDRVQPGEVLGEVGAEGNATGCHLHFEVRPGGGQPVDPTQWLSEHIGRSPDAVPAGGAERPTQETVVLMTSNVSSDLTNREAGRRIRKLLAERPDVLLIQEVRKRNVPALVDQAQGNWSTWQPAGAKGGSAIVWNADEFSAGSRGAVLGVDDGVRDRWVPWVLLESDAGTLPVVALHLPPAGSSNGEERRHLRTMTHSYVALINEMSEAGYPPVVGGEWNRPLDVPQGPLSPVSVLDRLGMTTNWRGDRPCEGSIAGGRTDGFAFNAGYLQIVDQGCLASGGSDHRPVWVALAPIG